jgi:hypothetical protein
MLVVYSYVALTCIVRCIIVVDGVCVVWPCGICACVSGLVMEGVGGGGGWVFVVCGYEFEYGVVYVGVCVV